MGSPKALLPLAGKSFLAHLIEVFSSSRARPILVVIGHAAERIRAEVTFGEAVPLVNPRYRDGMLSSLRMGIGALSDASVKATLVCPVDHPRTTPAVADKLIERFELTRRPIVVPVHQGRRGHPVLFSRSVFAELLQAPDAVGARQVVWDHAHEVLEVETPQGGIHIDVDTPEEYRKLLESK